MRNFRTASSFTSRNTSSTPPILTLMLYHYSVARAASQGSGPDSGTLASRMARGCSSTAPEHRIEGSKPGRTGLLLKPGGLDARDAPAFRFLGEDDSHANAARIWFLKLIGGFPCQRDQYGFAAHKLHVLDFSQSPGPPLRGENDFCSLMDVRGANPKSASSIHKLPIGGKHSGEGSCLAVTPCVHKLLHGYYFFRGLLLWIDGRASQLFSEPIERQPAFGQEAGGKAAVFAQNTEEQVVRADIFVSQPFRLLRSFFQDARALRAKRHFHCGGNPLATLDLGFDFLTDRLLSAFFAKKFASKRVILAQ